MFCRIGIHSWGSWFVTEKTIGGKIHIWQSRRCERCEFTQANILVESESKSCEKGGHDWGAWQKHFDRSIFQHRKCKKCGFVEEVSI